MCKALLFLRCLQARAAWRMMLRACRNPAKILFGLFCAGFALLMLVPPTFEQLDFPPDLVLFFGPALLIGFLGGLLFFRSPPLSGLLSGAGTDWLLQSPAPRRLLLAYQASHLAVPLFLLSIFGAFWLADTFGGWTRSFFISLAIIALGISTLETTLHAVAAAEARFPRMRRGIRAGVRALLILWVLEIAFATKGSNLRQFLEEDKWEPLLHSLQATSFSLIALAPFYPVRLMAEAANWPAFFAFGLLSVIAVGGFGGLVFLLNYDFRMDAVILSGQRERAEEAIRQGKPSMTRIRGNRRHSLPSLPFCRGAGPVAWVCLTENWRLGLLPILSMLALVLLAIAVLEWNSPSLLDEVGAVFFVVLGFWVLWLTVCFCLYIPGNSLDQLKILPLAPSALVCGRLAAVVLTCWVSQILFVVPIALWMGQLFAATIMLILFLPVNLLFGSVWESLRFSFASTGETRPTEIVTMGIVSMLVGFLLFVCAVVIAAAAAWTVGVHTGGFGIPAIVAAWLSLAFAATAFLFVAASSFKHAGPVQASN